MVQYTQTEMLTELSQIFRGRTDPVRSGGVVDPIAIHEQILEIAKTVLLLNPGAIFYLAKLIRNTLLLTVRQEIAIIEDMLIALDDIVRPPGDIGDVSVDDLSNATTALIALEFAGSVDGRPELLRFQRIMDRFTDEFRSSIVSPNGQLVLPRGEAREVLVTNLVSLKSLHATFLQILNGLISLIEEYNALDIPSKVSQTALINIRKQLVALQESINVSTTEQLLSDSRLIVLRSLASKVVVALLEQFNRLDLTTAKLTSANTGTVADTNSPVGVYTLRAAGEGTAAFVLTAPGPWRLDELDSADLSFRIDDGPIQTVDLSVVQGPGIHGANAAPFTDAQLYPVWPGPGGPTDPPPPPIEDYEPKPNLHIVVDPREYEFTSQEWGHVDENGTFFGPVGGPGDPDPAMQRGEPKNDLIDDPRTVGVEAFLVSDYWNTVRMQPPVKLGFKHLGCLLFIELGEVGDGSFGTARKGAGFGGWDVGGSDTLDDAGEWSNLEERRWDYVLRPRTIYDLELLTTVTLTHISGSTYSVASSAGEPHWVGFYARIGTEHSNYERYEIVRAASNGSELEFDLRGDLPSVISGPTKIFGQRGDRSQVTFFPDLLADTDEVADSAIGDEHGPAEVPNTATIKVSPAVKTARVASGSGTTITATINSLNTVAFGDYDYPDNRYQHAAYHCIFKDQNGFSDRITVQNRSRFLPDALQISGTFFRTKMFLPPTVVSALARVQYPGPVPLIVVERSGHEVFGFSVGQSVDPTADPFLSVEELNTLLQDIIDPDTTLTEIVETEVFGGLLRTIAGTFDVQDTTADFTELGVGLGFVLEIQDGDNAGVYFIETAAGPLLTLARPPGKPSTGFVGNESSLPYRIFIQQVKISSTNTGPGSSVKVTAAPSSFQLPSDTVYGVVPFVEAVNALDGSLLDLSGLAPGDTSKGLIIQEANGTQAAVVGGVASNHLSLSFAFEGKTEADLEKMLSDLKTIRDSRSLLKSRHFDVNLFELDAALSAVITPGQTLISNVNHAKNMLGHLLAVLTSEPPLEDQYSAVIADLAPNVEAATVFYDAPTVRAVDALLDSLNEYGFDRALSLLLTGRLEDFFDTTAATASFSGALLAAAQTVAFDVPAPTTLESEGDTVEPSFVSSPDSNEDFTDTTGARQDSV